MAALLADSHPGFVFGQGSALAFLFLGLTLCAGIGALSHARERAFSSSIVYLVLGVAAGLVVRATGKGQLVEPIGGHAILERVTTGALVLALFATGMRLRRPLRRWQSPARLLGLAMPMTIAGVAAWAAGLMGLSLAAAIALGAALAPTDPVLAGDLGVGPPTEGDDEDESEVEFALTSEAGLNDGLGLPFVVLGITLVSGGGAGRVGHWLGADLLYGVIVGIVVGAAIGYVAIRAIGALRERELLMEGLDAWVGLPLAFIAYGAAESLSAYGFLAVFAAGIAFRRGEDDYEYNRRVHDGAELLKHFAELAVILVLGSTLSLGHLGRAGAWGLLLVPLLLLVVRPLTVWLSLLRSPLRPRERLWIGWFGVKGVASLNYLALIAAARAFSLAERETVVWTILFAIGVSIVVHGVTAAPLTGALLGDERHGV